MCLRPIQKKVWMLLRRNMSRKILHKRYSSMSRARATSSSFLNGPRALETGFAECSTSGSLHQHDGRVQVQQRACWRVCGGTGVTAQLHTLQEQLQTPREKQQKTPLLLISQTKKVGARIYLWKLCVLHLCSLMVAAGVFHMSNTWASLQPNLSFMLWRLLFGHVAVQAIVV